ncbi:siroheme synthase [Dehalogenimonas lykanthroporepellens BL-DC-9]|nr:siroheme synthase [Dehalogenimonas lykanthroporepellens BL-DC-9]
MRNRNYYPVFLDLTGKKCLVVGGGAVAWRKVESLLGSGAEVTVISPSLIPEINRLAEQSQVTIVNRVYAEGDLLGFFMVIAATDDVMVNGAVFREASKLGMLVNVVDDTANSNFIVPSVLRRGDMAIAVSTSGSSPALARRIKSDLTDIFGEEYADVVSLVGQIREELLVKGVSIAPEKWQTVLNLKLLAEKVKTGNQEEARNWLRQKLLEDR